MPLHFSVIRFAFLTQRRDGHHSDEDKGEAPECLIRQSPNASRALSTALADDAIDDQPRARWGAVVSTKRPQHDSFAVNEGETVNEGGAASGSSVPPPLPMPPPPPAGWRWPREGDRVEIEVEEEGATLWRAATVVSVISTGPEAGWFSARMLHDDEWVDWFTWQEEGKDWRRTGGKRKLSATTP